jgi:hypothetical protein
MNVDRSSAPTRADAKVSEISRKAHEINIGGFKHRVDALSKRLAIGKHCDAKTSLTTARNTNNIVAMRDH